MRPPKIRQSYIFGLDISCMHKNIIKIMLQTKHQTEGGGAVLGIRKLSKVFVAFLVNICKKALPPPPFYIFLLSYFSFPFLTFCYLAFILFSSILLIILSMSNFLLFPTILLFYLHFTSYYPFHILTFFYYM